MRSSTQCPSTFSGRVCSRTTTTVFCRRREGHKGDHRGYRAQWNQQGKKVPITLKEKDLDDEQEGAVPGQAST